MFSGKFTLQMEFPSVNLQGRSEIGFICFFLFTLLSLRRKVLDMADLTLSLYSDNQETLFKAGHDLCSLAIRVFQMHEVHFGEIKFIRTFLNV